MVGGGEPSLDSVDFEKVNKELDELFAENGIGDPEEEPPNEERKIN